MVGTKQWIWIAVAFILARRRGHGGPCSGHRPPTSPNYFRRSGGSPALRLLANMGSILAGGPAPFVATALVAWSGSWWPVACYAALLSAITAFAIWCGPETYTENIATDNTSDGAIHPAAMPAQA